MINVRRALIVFCSVFFIIIIAPVIGEVTSQVVLLDRTQDPIVIREASSNGIQEAFAYPITLTEYQKVDIEFSMSFPNSSSTLLTISLTWSKLVTSALKGNPLAPKTVTSFATSLHVEASTSLTATFAPSLAKLKAIAVLDRFNPKCNYAGPILNKLL